MQKHHLLGVERDEALTFLRDGAHSTLHPELAAKLNDARRVDPKHVRMLTLAREWLQSYLPHCLMKINRVSFGIFSAEDHQRALALDPFMPRSRAKLAIPFVGKDVPSRSSEFAHPDIIIGLTVLAYRYEGLRKVDFEQDIIALVRATFEKEIGPFRSRKSSIMYEQWVAAAGGAIKGGFAAKAAREQRGGEADAAAAAAAAAGGSPPASPSTGGGGGGGGAVDVARPRPRTRRRARSSRCGCSSAPTPTRWPSCSRC